MVAGDLIIDDDFDEDGCSICLDPFTSLHPASVTKCRHEYHLHCILEWSRRRSQCPVCLQHLVLNDPASQEMVAAVARENESKLKRTNRANEHLPRARESDRERQMRRRAAAAAMRARRIMAARRRRPSSINQAPFLRFPATDSSPRRATPAGVRSRSNEFLAFSESLKSKLSTASARYRESLLKGTRSLKEKIRVRNNSVKELSRGVKREMSAGIAGIARLIARKRAAV